MKAGSVYLVYHKGQEWCLAHSKLHVLPNQPEVHRLGEPAPLDPADENMVPVHMEGFIGKAVGSGAASSEVPDISPPFPSDGAKTSLGPSCYTWVQGSTSEGNEWGESTSS